MCTAGTVSPPEVASARRLLKHRQVVLLDVSEQDLRPPVDGPEQGSEPLGAALAVPELPVQAQGVQQQALQSARPQRAHRRRREAAGEEQKRHRGKGLSREGWAERKKAVGHSSKDVSRGKHVYPEERRTRSLLLKTLLMVTCGIAPSDTDPNKF